MGVAASPASIEDPSLGLFQHHPRGLAEAERAHHFVLDGVQRHALIWDDPMGDSFPRHWHVVVFNMLFAAILAGICFCRHPMPGSATRAILAHLRLEARPPASDFIWDYVVRGAHVLSTLLMPHIPWATIDVLVTASASLFAVLAVGLFTVLLLRVGYLVRNECAPESLRREAMGRRLSALAGGLFLAASTPWLIISSRSLPTSFSFLGMLSCLWFFGTFQHGGRRWRLAIFTFSLGACMASFGTAWLFAPLLIVLACIETIRWRLAHSFLTWLAFVVPLLLGLALYILYAQLLAGRGAWLGLYHGPLDAFLAIVRTQLSLVTQIHVSPIVIVFACIVGIPWCTLFLLSRRCPWFYEWPQTSIRLFFLGGLVAILYSAPFSPQNLVPGTLDNPVVVPTAILALCYGYMAGEFWCLGQARPLVDRRMRHRLLRHVSTLFAVLMPLASLAAPAWNVRFARVPSDIWSATAADYLLDARGSRSAFLLEAPLDDLVLLEAYQRHQPVLTFSASRMFDPVYQRVFASHFPTNSDIHASLRAGQLETAIRYWLDDTNIVSATLATIRPDLLNEYAFLPPGPFSYATSIDPASVSSNALPATIASLMPYWQAIADDTAARGRFPVPPGNPFLPYHLYLGALSATLCNNSGVLCANAGLMPIADTLFTLASTINSNNLAARMNALRTAEVLRPDDPATHEARASFDHDSLVLGGQRWVISARYGYLYDPDAWVRDGYVWALSGAPLCPPAARRHAAIEMDIDGRFAHFIDQAFVASASVHNSEVQYRFALMRNPWDAHAILELARLALRDKRPDVCDAYVDEAIASTGTSPADVLYERTMADYVRILLALESPTAPPVDPANAAAFPAPPAAPLLARAGVRSPELWTAADGTLRNPLHVFQTIARTTIHDMRTWMTLYLLANGKQPITEQIEKTFRNTRPNDVDLWTTLASIRLDRNDLKGARSALNHALNLSIDRVALWELAMTIAERSGNGRLFSAAEKQLISTAPFHSLVFQARGRAAYDRGDLDEAIHIFHLGIFLERNPVLLNNLAHVLAEKDRGNCERAIQLVDEAIRRDPAQPRYLNTRAMLHLRNGEPTLALADMKKRFRGGQLAWPEFIQLAEVYNALGRPEMVRETLRAARRTLKIPPPPASQPRVLSLEAASIR